MTLLSHQHYPAYDPIQLIGEVSAIDQQQYTVMCDGKAWQCQLAASCLLRPELGDTVLISGPDTSRVFLLAVIEQANPDQATIRVAGNLHLQSQSLSMQASQGRWQFDHLHYRGEKLDAQIGAVRLLGKMYEAVVDRLRLMSRNATKITSETDRTRVGTLDVQAEHAAHLHSKMTTVTASEFVKVDGKQIHMG